MLSPAVSVSLICVLCGVAGRPQPLAGLGWAVLLSGFCAAVPVSTTHVAVRRNHLTDRHVTRREQRWSSPPWWLLALLPLLPAVTFARLRLRHHTPGEIALGMVLAVAVMLTARPLMPVTT